MKNIINLLLVLALFMCTPSYANDNLHKRAVNHKTIEERQKEIDEMLDSRLHLTQEQKDYIRINRPKHTKEMREIIDKMQILHDNIKNIYHSGIPKMQADIKTAPLKTELGILKQNADKLKEENKRNFENILNDEQKIEFEKIKNEYAQKRLNKN